MKPGSALVLLAVLPALGACDKIMPGAGGNNSAAVANQSGGGKVAAAGDTAMPRGGGPVSDAGITDSRALGGLGGGGAPDGGKPAGPPPVMTASSSDPIDPQALVGRWGDFGSCADPIDMRADGSFTTANGGRGNWRLNGDVLTMNGPGGNIDLRLQSVAPSRIVLVNPDGSVGQSQRC